MEGGGGGVGGVGAQFFRAELRHPHSVNRRFSTGGRGASAKSAFFWLPTPPPLPPPPTPPPPLFFPAAFWAVWVLVPPPPNVSQNSAEQAGIILEPCDEESIL